MRKRIYVAGPISQGPICENVARATRVGCELIRRGYAAFVPQLSCFMGYDGGRDANMEPGAGDIGHHDWIETDLPWVAVADAVLRLPGASEGADKETEYAETLNIPVFFGGTDDEALAALCECLDTVQVVDNDVAEWSRRLFTQAEGLTAGIDECSSHRTFETGSVRDNRAGKGRFDLLPPAALRRLAQHFERGANKYGEHNWRKGQPLQSYLDSALRHIFNHQQGMRDEDHLIAAAWNLLALVETQTRIDAGELPATLDDFPYEHVEVTL